MMITNKILIEEVEELKSLLSQGKAEIPSFWECLWPGVVLGKVRISRSFLPKLTR